MSRKERLSKGVTPLSKDRIFPEELLKSHPGNIHVIDGKYFLHLTDYEVMRLNAVPPRVVNNQKYSGGNNIFKILVNCIILIKNKSLN